MQTILYSNKKLGKARKYKVRWVVEYPDEWLTYDKVPVTKHMKETFETRNGNRTHNKGQKKLKSSSGGATARTNEMIQKNKVEA